MSPKGYALWEMTKRKILLHGPRKTTKSNCAQNKLIQHAYDNNGAVVGIVVKGKISATSTGVWQDFVGAYGLLATEWFPTGLTRYVDEPSMTSDTKLRTFSIQNRYGGKSEFQLHTLQHDHDAEKVFKDTRFSAIYMVEADRFEDRRVFSRLVEQLRVPHVPHERRMIILDCNPPESGDRHWIYSTFLYNEQGEYIPGIDPDFAEIGYTMDDNPFIPDAEKQEIYENNKYDSNQLDRLYFGKWVRNTKAGCFGEQFIPSIHVIGTEGKTKAGEVGTVLVPAKDCYEMPCGWDLGDSKNHGFVIGAKRHVGHTTVFDIVDEVSIIGQPFKLETIVQTILKKLHAWEDWCAKAVPGRRMSVRHLSDPSSMRFLTTAASGSVAEEVRRYSEGEIRLMPVPKGAGSVHERRELLRRLLFEQRIFVSSRCRTVIDMLQFLKAGEDGDGIDERSEYEHIFAALTYMLVAESPVMRKNRTPSESVAPHGSHISFAGR